MKKGVSMPHDFVVVLYVLLIAGDYLAEAVDVVRTSIPDIQSTDGLDESFDYCFPWLGGEGGVVVQPAEISDISLLIGENNGG